MVNRVDFFGDANDFRVVLLGSLGFSTGYIQSFTGLSAGQVMYRLGKAMVKRSDYREGRSHLAVSMLKRNESSITQHVARELRKSLGLREARGKDVA